MVIDFKSIEEALSQKTSKYFWIMRDENGQMKCGDPQSFYGKNINDDKLTFDVSNNKVLVNVSFDGSIKNFTSYRKSFEVDSIPGVWWYKDFTSSGPFHFSLEIDGNVFELHQVSWPLKVSLLGNIFPLFELNSEKIKASLIIYAPISEDGVKRAEGVVYGILIENKSKEVLNGSISLKGPNSMSVSSIYIGLMDKMDHKGKAIYRLNPGDRNWFPFIITSVRKKEEFDEINERTSLDWLNSTWTYFRKILGNLEMPQDDFTKEFFERAIYQCFGAIGMTKENEIVGSNWGTNPATNAIWMKDMYYSFLPFYMFEPELFKKGILWFLDRSVRFEGNNYKGGVNHSLSNSLTPVIMSCLYYTITGDNSFFIKNPPIKTKILEILGKVLDSREGEIWLFPSQWISDGRSLGDYHTGSNLCAWYCFKVGARIMKEVYNDDLSARNYIEVAQKIRIDLEKHNTINGPFGPQYIEGTNKDRSVPYLGHDGEESDTTLMPVYDFTDYDDSKYKNYTRFALTDHNCFYIPETRGIRWDGLDGTPLTDSTFPGFITGFASITNNNEMNGENGYTTVIRQLTDIDGSIWWWPYPRGGKFGNPIRGYIGKCGWASGVFVALFVTSFLGIKFDGAIRKLEFRPFSPSSDFRWIDFSLGQARFDVEYQRRGNHVEASVTNKNKFNINSEFQIIMDKNSHLEKLTLNGIQYDGVIEYGEFLGRNTIKVTTNIDSDETIALNVLYGLNTHV